MYENFRKFSLKILRILNFIYRDIRSILVLKEFIHSKKKIYMYFYIFDKRILIIFLLNRSIKQKIRKAKKKKKEKGQ